MKLTKGKIALAAVALLAIVGVVQALRPPFLVSMDVQNEELRSVVRKLERKTRQTILVHKDLNARLTFNVRKMPLQGVLTVIGDQASAQWAQLYPLYTTKQSLALLEKKLIGEPIGSTDAWTNLPTALPPMIGGMFDQQPRPQNRFLSLNIVNQDLEMTSLAINRFAQAQLVPENGTKAQITLKITQSPAPKAVAKIAQQAKRNWARLFVLVPRPNAPPPQLAQPRRGPPGGPRPGMMPPPPSEDELANMPPEQRERVQKQQDFLKQQMEAQIQAMPPAQRAQAMQRQQQMDAMRNLSPQQRQQAMSQMGGGGPGGGAGGSGGGGGPGGPSAAGGAQTGQSAQQLNQTLLNTTSDQRVDKARRMQSK